MKSRHNKRSSKKKLLFPFAGLVILLAAGYVGGALYFQDKFLPNTTVNEMKIGSKSLDAANTSLTAQVNHEVFTFTDNGKTTQTINLSDLGKTIDFSNELKKLQTSQSSWSWPAAFFTKTEKTIGNFAINDEEINTYVTNTLTPALTTLNEGRTKSADATLAFADGKFSVQPEVVGNYLHTDAIVAALKEKITAGEKTLELEDYVTQPSIKKDDAKLTTELAQANKIAEISANYTINDAKIAIPSETIQSWLTFTDGKVGVNTESVKAYVTALGAKYNTSVASYSFKSTKRGQVDVPAGSYSWSIQVNSETEALSSAILAGEDFTRTPIVKGAGSASGARIGNTYIEVDKTNQHMWYYKDGALVLETDVVTGKPSTPTPSGVFYVWNKELNSTLNGTNADGSAYATPVNYWMPVNWTGVGIHDANWQPTFGGTWYQAHGSHGCVNTPPGVMAKLYEAVSTDTPVLIF